MRSRVFQASWWVALVALCAARSALGGGSIHDIAERMPANVDVLVALDRACVARVTPCGRVVVEAAHQFMRSDALEGAWAELGRALDRTPEQTFDELLGRRVALAVRRTPEGSPAWVIRTVVSLDTERRLRERLRVAPRTIVAGRSVLAVERGGLELTTERGSHWATVLLGPAAAPGLFDEMARSMRCGPESPMSADARFASMQSLGDGELLVFVKGLGAGAEDGWFGCVAQTDGDSLRIGIRAGADSLAGCDAEAPRTSRAVFDRMARGALLAALERPVASRGPDSALGALLSQLPALALGPEQSALIGDRFALLALPGERAPSFAAALELRSASLGAPAIDRIIGHALALAGVAGQRFDGLEPGAVREARIDAAAFAGACAPLFAERGVEWSYPLAARPHPATDAMAATMESVPSDAGWCVASVGAGAGERLRAALTSAGEACPGRGAGDAENAQPTHARWVSLGKVRPAALLGAMRRSGMALPASVAAFERVEAAEWSVRLDADNALTGEALVRVADTRELAGGEPTAESRSAPRAHRVTNRTPR